MQNVSLFAIFLLAFSTATVAQVRINGKVIDRTTRQPIPFASVGQVGTTRGTSTNINGEFSMVFPPNASLKVSCVGYVSAIVHNPADNVLIELTPYAVELPEIVVTARPVNARQVVRRAFAAVPKNYPVQPFLQRFFYRHYCRDNAVYGRLIEAFVDVWKHNGYRSFRQTGGEREELRVTHLRRSLDHTVFASSHPPIAVSSILPADVAAYQTLQKGALKNFFAEASTLYTDFNEYDFSYHGITQYDNHQVYVIAYRSHPDSVLTTSGYLPAPSVSGTLYITTTGYAFVKCEELREAAGNRFRSVVHYVQHNQRYYASHMVRESEIQLAYGSTHYVHVELVSTDIGMGDQYRFTGKEPNREELLGIPYDSSFWNEASILKATPLEEKIISDLGGGASLNRQFFRYIHYEWSTTHGEKEAEEKLKWLLIDSKGRKPVLMAFFPADARPYLADIEKFKQLNRQYRGQAVFVISVAEPDENRWKQLSEQLVLFADGIIVYRIPERSVTLRNWSISRLPALVFADRSGRLQILQGGTDEAAQMLQSAR
ncbi:MAG: hypothetical protein KatS3mg032_1471 [Cyclobacteriaceae bacterium]|nr:MAG: hypothetical protein KatS3mg032_1471 [Cyclobacteriaceae bacterium]